MAGSIGASATGLGTSASTGASAPAYPIAGYPQWEYDLLAAIKAPVSGVSLRALSLWAASEGTAPSANNPLAVCCTPAGNNGYIVPPAGNNGYPVYSYGSESAGVSAMAQAILNYPGITSSLRSGRDLYSIFSTINSSRWCAGCEKGHYPSVLYAAIADPNAPGNVLPGGNTGPQGSNPIGTCEAKGNIFGVLGLNFTYCNLKSITGAAAIVIGGVTMGLGVILIAAFGLAGSRTGRQATALASRAPGPVGSAAKGIRSVSSGKAAPAKVKAPATVEEPEGAHVARGRHAQGVGVRSTEAVRRHKETVGREEAEESAFQAKEARAADRRNLRVMGRTPRTDREDFQRRTA